jgi:hypothetical protein
MYNISLLIASFSRDFIARLLSQRVAAKRFAESQNFFAALKNRAPDLQRSDGFRTGDGV